MNTSAAWVSVNEVTRPWPGSGTDYLPLVYNRRPGIYFNDFTLVITGTNRGMDTSSFAPKSYGIWRIPYYEAPRINSSSQTSDNSTNVQNMAYTPLGGTRQATAYMSKSNNSLCFTGSAAALGGAQITLDANYKYWYRIYPGDGAVTASNVSGSIFGGAKTVTFATPTACSWPTYYNGTNYYNSMKTGSLWPDILVSCSATDIPDDPEYHKNNGIFTYQATGAANGNKTTASVNLPANQIYNVKVRLGVDNGYSDRQDVEYSKVNGFTYDTYEPPTISPAAGTYWSTQDIVLSSPGGCDIYYTLDGSEPTKENGIKYTTPIQLTESAKIRTRQYRGDTAVGTVADFNYTINTPGVKADPAAGGVGKGTKVALSLDNGDTEHIDIYYTENDALPYDRWMPYTSPIEITKDITLYAVARDKISGRYGEKAAFVYQYSELGYILNDLSFWEGGTKVTSTDLSALAGKTLTAKANITKIIPTVQGWLVTALYDPSGRAAQVKLDKLDQISGAPRGDVVGKSITLPEDTADYVLKTFIVHNFAQLRPVGSIVQIGQREEQELK